MNTLFLGIVTFLIVLAVFDLVVGVSNDAVNFLNSAIGAKVARYRTIVTIASIGVFAGAALSNGMMDVARHVIMTPQYFSFYDVMCVFLAVMVTDVVLLDVFNTLGMPTSTTVSMVFELLGGAFAIALLQILHGATAEHGESHFGHPWHFPQCCHCVCPRHAGAVGGTRRFHFYIPCERENDRSVRQDGKSGCIVVKDWYLWWTISDGHCLVPAYQRIEE